MGIEDFILCYEFESYYVYEDGMNLLFYASYYDDALAIQSSKQGHHHSMVCLRHRNQRFYRPL